MRFITDWLVNSNVIEENEVSLYNYAIENFVLTATPFSLTLIYGFLIEVPVEAACIVLFVLVSRKYLGGVHLKSKMGCLLLSTFILCSFVYIISLGIDSDIFLIPVVLLSLSAWLLSPVESESKPLSECEKRIYSIVSRVIIVFLLLGYFASMKIELKTTESCIACAIMLTGIAQMPVYFK